MPKNPVFSIITVTLNNLSGLQKTDLSLKIQSFQDFEWIVMDGGSTDGTQDYLAHTKASWLSKPDNGIYDAMNRGLAKAAGDYILFLNAGDKLAFANTLARIHNFIKSEKLVPDFLYGDSLEGGAYKPARAHTDIKRGMFTHHQAMVYRREALHGLGYDTRYKIAADYDFTAQAVQRADHVIYFPLPVCVFEQGGVSQKNATRGRNEQFMVRHRHQVSNVFENAAIYLLQAAAWTGRRIVPALYWRVKSSGNKTPGFAQN
jgi:putative colanic acid biosynthesis glycosyltransferase